MRGRGRKGGGGVVEWFGWDVHCAVGWGVGWVREGWVCGLGVFGGVCHFDVPSF